jgi:hypothetical protein
MVLIGLGTVWILDGLEVRIVGALASTIVKHSSGTSITTAQIGDAARIYVGGRGGDHRAALPKHPRPRHRLARLLLPRSHARCGILLVRRICRPSV